MNAGRRLLISGQCSQIRARGEAAPRNDAEAIASYYSRWRMQPRGAGPICRILLWNTGYSSLPAVQQSATKC